MALVVSRRMTESRGSSADCSYLSGAIVYEFAVLNSSLSIDSHVRF